MTEKEIIAGCKANDRLAQRALVDKYSPYLFGICVRYAVDKSLAKDCLQEALVRIMTKIDTYSERGKFRSWMAQVTAMKCLEIMRREKRYRAEEMGDQISVQTDQKVFAQMRQEEVITFMNQLPDNYRIALNMYIVEGYSHKEIGDLLGVTESSSRSLVTRGRKIIQEAFKNEGPALQSIVNNKSLLRKVK